MPPKTKLTKPSQKPAAKPEAKRKAGRPVGTGFIPTAEQRNMVEVLTGMIIPDDQIAQLITDSRTGEPIGESTLKKHFRKELTRGRTAIKVRHHMALFKEVEKGNVTALIWWDKTRNHISEKISFGLGNNQSVAATEVNTADPDKTSILDVARRIAFTLSMGADIAAQTSPQSTPAKPKQPA